MSELEEKVDDILRRVVDRAIDKINGYDYKENTDEILSLIKEEVDKALLDKPISINPFCVGVKENKRHQLVTEEFVKKFRDLFPSDCKGDKAGVTAKLKQFFNDNKEYSDEFVIMATRAYIIEQRKKNNPYYMLAHNFIKKDKISMLAGYCEQSNEKGVKEVKEEKNNTGLGSTQEI